jgi:hypothetical protein
VVLNQLGSAFGAMDIIIPISILITMALVKLYQTLFLGGEEIAPETYSQEEKDSAVNALAISLLLTRDHLRYYERKLQQSKEKKRRTERRGRREGKGEQEEEQQPQSGKTTGESTPFTPIKLTLDNNRNRGGKGTTTTITLLSNEMNLTDIYENNHHHDDDKMKNQNSPMSRGKKSIIKPSFNERSEEEKDNKDKEDDGEEETEEIQILRQENHLYRKVIYPFLKILSDDSSYHSNAHNLKKVLDFMQPPSSEEEDDEKEEKKNKKKKRKTIGINAEEGEEEDNDPESAYSAIPPEVKKDKNNNNKSKETDYLLRLSRDLIDEEDEKKRRQKELQLLPVEYNPKTKRFSEVISSLLPHPTVSLTSSSARKGEKVYSGQYRRVSRSDAVSETNSQPNNNIPITATTDLDTEIPLRRNMIIVNKLSSSPSSISSNKSSKMTNHNSSNSGNYIIRGKEDILKKLKELIFTFQLYSDSASHSSPSSTSTTDRRTLQAVRIREETFQLTNSLLLMDESSLGSNEEDLVEFYQCLYELLLIHVLLLVNNCSSSSSFDGEGNSGEGGSTKEPPVQRMFYQVGGGISRNGVLKDKVSYYSLQDLHARIHCLTS